MSGDACAAPMKATRAGIERWTAAVFGTKFISNGKTYRVGTQKDAHSCGICVINGIDASIHGSNLFTRATRSKHRLEYFIATVNHLLQGQVHPRPAGALVPPAHHSLGQG